jgi:hypothetical protein
VGATLNYTTRVEYQDLVHLPRLYLTNVLVTRGVKLQSFRLRGERGTEPAVSGVSFTGCYPF